MVWCLCSLLLQKVVVTKTPKSEHSQRESNYPVSYILILNLSNQINFAIRQSRMHAPTVGTFCFHKIAWMEMTVQKLKWIMLMCLAGILLHYYVKTSTAFQQQLSEESQQKSTKMGCESQKTRRSTYLQLKWLLEWALFLSHM